MCASNMRLKRAHLVVTPFAYEKKGRVAYGVQLNPVFEWLRGSLM